MNAVLDWIYSNLHRDGGTPPKKQESLMCFREGRWNLVNPETHVAEMSMSADELDRFVGKHIEPFDDCPFPIHCFNGTIPPP